jgi:cobalt-zinc-cadmium efflux system protein
MHHHHHPHGHSHDAERSTRALKGALAVTLAVLVAEVVGGVMSNSLALLADAGHVLTDSAALGLSLFVAWFARQPVSAAKTYGYLRWEIIAALLNGTTLLLVSVWIVIEALARFRTPEPIGGTLMLVIAAAGLVANVIAALMLHPVNKSSLNVRGAYLHVLSDLLASVGTIVAAVVIALTGWLYADPLASLLTTALIVRGAWQLVRESVDVLLEAAPKHIAIGEVRSALQGIPGVESVHDLHVWTVTSGVVVLSAHAIVREPERQQEVLERACDLMGTMGIHHCTIQIERTEMAGREPHLHP